MNAFVINVNIWIKISGGTYFRGRLMRNWKDLTVVGSHTIYWIGFTVRYYLFCLPNFTSYGLCIEYNPPHPNMLDSHGDDNEVEYLSPFSLLELNI